MNTAVQIVAILCGTVVALAWLGRNWKDKDQ